MSNGGNPLPPARVPTLTEVVAWPNPVHVPAGDVQQLPLPTVEAQPVEADVLGTQPLRVGEEQLIEGVLAEVQRQVDLVLDYRMREILTPLLARAADGIVRDARSELALTLRDVVARAVAQELSRHRTR